MAKNTDYVRIKRIKREYLPGTSPLDRILAEQEQRRARNKKYRRITGMIRRKKRARKLRGQDS